MKRKQQKSISSFFFLKKAHIETEGSSSPNSPLTQQTLFPSIVAPSIVEEMGDIPQNQEDENEHGDIPNPTSQAPTVGERLKEEDFANLPRDPGKRRKMIDFHPDDRDLIRRAYICKGLCQPKDYGFPFRHFGKDDRRRFNPKWFDKYKPWLEYSVEKDASFCFACYLFKDDNSGSDAFVSDGFRTWSKTSVFKTHIGGHLSSHNQAMMSLADFKNQKASLPCGFTKQTRETTSEYKERLEASIKCLKWLVLQGLPTRGHDETETSLNKGNFLELLKFHAAERPDVQKVVLKNGPGNCQMTAPCIQKDIINACAKETTSRLLEELGDDFFSILADESADIVDKEQLVICLRYIDKSGHVMERFLSIVHVPNTTSLTLKVAIETLLMDHCLTFSRVRGQGYDGASNMQGCIGGLKTLVLNESPSAYFVHCFAHQLQLTLVAVAKKNNDCCWLFEDVLPLLLNFVGGSPKRKEFLREKQKESVTEALSTGELETRTGLHQELSLVRPGDTRWGSHYKTIVNVLNLYVPILESLDAIAKAASKEKNKSDENKACGITKMLMSFDFIFVAHMMGSIFSITNALNLALQKRYQDIVNAMCMVDVTKRKLQDLRDNGCDDLLKKVTSFMAKSGIEVPDMDAWYVSPGRTYFRGNKQRVKNVDHFRVEVFLSVLDLQLQELENLFSEKSKKLLICMSCFNPANRFSSFDKSKLVELAGFYEKEFSGGDLIFFEHSLDIFIDDMLHDERFWNLKNLNELSVKLVKTGKHITYSQVYLLLKLVLLLSVATASVERAFSEMNDIKSKLRNSMGDQLLNDSLVTFLEKDLFLDVSLAAIVSRFQSMRTRPE